MAAMSEEACHVHWSPTRLPQLSARMLLAVSVVLFAFVDCASATERIHVVLIGDSTMAKTTGYGDALCARFDRAVDCENLARGGRSSKSYRAEGLWDDALRRLRAPGYAATYVFIQFGHNDQPGKPGRSTTLPEFRENLRRYVGDVREARATPVLVTPLTRRSFKEGRLVDGLRPWADVASEVATEMKIASLDLHADSMRVVQTLGAEKALALAEVPAPADAIKAAQTGTTIEVAKPSTPPNTPSGHVPAFDYTHLGAAGASLFSQIVADEIGHQVPGLAPHLHGLRKTAASATTRAVDTRDRSQF